MRLWGQDDVVGVGCGEKKWFLGVSAVDGERTRARGDRLDKSL